MFAVSNTDWNTKSTLIKLHEARCHGTAFPWWMGKTNPDRSQLSSSLEQKDEQAAACATQRRGALKRIYIDALFPICCPQQFQQ